MAEILTESFCERCGTRYTFQAGAPRRRGIGRIRTLTRGVKNFVANDNASFAEAMEAAREDEERTASAQQLDAFHETFNFCMGCRQYTCRNCWNSDAGECLSCAPDLSRDVLPPPFPRLVVVEAPEPDHPGRDESAWPTSDLRPALVPAVTESFPPAPVGERRAETTELAETSPHSTNGRPPTPGTDLELTPDELRAIQGALARHVGPLAEGPTAAPGSGTPPRVEAVPPAPAEPMAEARAETRRLLGRFRPRREHGATTHPVPAATRDAEVAEPAVLEPAAAALPEVAAPEPEATISTVEPAAAELEIAELGVAEPAAAEPEVAELETGAPVATVEPAAAEPETAEPESAVEPAPAATPAPPPADQVAQPTWRMVAPDGAPPAQPASTPWPAFGGRRTEDAIPTAPWAARVAAARSVETPVWAVSSRDLLAAPTSDAGRPVSVQSCVACGLSLSSNARFCRRCGTRQG
jgi:hypothetical protein